MKKIYIIVILMLLFASPLFAGTYYVDDNGAATWANCKHDAEPAGPKSGTAACSMKTANANVAPGDIVYIRGGEYTIKDTLDTDDTYQGINPNQSGTSGNYITYIEYPKETATFTGDGTNDHSYAIYLKERSYIRVSGLDFTSCNTFLLINGQRRSDNEVVGVSHNIIDNCSFIQCLYTEDVYPVSWRGSSIWNNASHNWIHDCTFGKYGALTLTHDAGVVFELGVDAEGKTDESNYNTIENCHFYQGGHHALGINTGRYNVIRNNYVHSEAWYEGGTCSECENGVCGYRVASMVGEPDYSGYNLIEDIIIAYGAQYGGPHPLPIGASGSGLSVGTSHNIIRYSNFFGNALYGLRFGSSFAYGVQGNRVYNNTFYHNGYGADDDEFALDALRCGLSFYKDNLTYPEWTYSPEVVGNVVKNNLFYDHWSEKNKRTTDLTYYPALDGVNATVVGDNTIENNYVDDSSSYLARSSTPFDGSADPKFVDPDISDPMALSFVDGEWTGKPDLSLQSTSPAINEGTYLTQANGSGSNSTTLAVDDASYFQDGTWGSSLAILTADYIAIGTVSNTVQISSINYRTNTITLSSAMTWSDNANIWLYKKSDGEIVLFNTGPDMGAHEYMGVREYIPPQGIQSPKNLQIVN